MSEQRIVMTDDGPLEVVNGERIIASITAGWASRRNEPHLLGKLVYGTLVFYETTTSKWFNVTDLVLVDSGEHLSSGINSIGFHRMVKDGDELPSLLFVSKAKPPSEANEAKENEKNV